ncbi:MAG TPA: glycoside hydrolase family 172 protein [Acidobacteriota bacterium]|nr:glycoside hydrolase family 172 protein [Acidobacteriota bacterium]
MRVRPLVVIMAILGASILTGQDLLRDLGRKQDFRSRRISSYDRSGGNRDSIVIEPGKTAVLAEIDGPGAIHHIWTTIAAEPFYGRKIVLRIYWDGERSPSVEAPIGDFFGVGHGLNRNFASLPITCSSEGRARNCYWYMPFRRSCRITAKNEGTRAVDAFYYYIDYRELPDLPADATYFHAQYRQEFPPDKRRDYTLVEAEGAGHYVGCSMSVLQRAMGWWGEGDDRIKVDGESKPSLHGTGSEDYFSDAWGMRQSQSLFYGCPLQEEDFQAGAKATVYRFHIPDPVPFKRSIQVTIEHGHANDRADLLSSVGYWYQTEPHKAFPSFPPVTERLPYAFEPPENFVLPQWREETAGLTGAFVDPAAGLLMSAPRLASSLTSYYNGAGARYPVLRTDGAADGTRAEFRFPVEVRDLYTVELHFLKSPAAGNVRISGSAAASGGPAGGVLGRIDGYAGEPALTSVTLEDLLLETGPNTLVFEVEGKDARSAGYDLFFVGFGLRPAARRFIRDWNLAGPFNAADMDDLSTVYPPETETAPAKSYKGKDGAAVGWRTFRADASGYVRLDDLIRPNEQAIVYGLAYVFSPDDRTASLLLGSDDGVRVWVNGELVHTNPIYRAAEPDLDRVSVRLKKGWNKVLVKDLQGAGGWGFYVRLADPEGVLRYALKPE